MTALSLPTALRAGAEGLYTLEAATGLIIAHASWLAREDFTPLRLHRHQHYRARRRTGQHRLGRCDQRPGRRRAAKPGPR
jgi:hypothetical protein